MTSTKETHFLLLFLYFYGDSESIVKYIIGLKTLLQQGISESVFYGDLVYKESLTVWALNAYFSDSQNAAFELLVWCM